MRVLPEEDLAVMTLPIGPVGWSTAAKSTPPRLPAKCRLPYAREGRGTAPGLNFLGRRPASSVSRHRTSPRSRQGVRATPECSA